MKTMDMKGAVIFYLQNKHLKIKVAYVKSHQALDGFQQYTKTRHYSVTLTLHKLLTHASIT